MPKQVHTCIKYHHQGQGLLSNSSTQLDKICCPAWFVSKLPSFWGTSQLARTSMSLWSPNGIPITWLPRYSCQILRQPPWDMLLAKLSLCIYIYIHRYLYLYQYQYLFIPFHIPSSPHDGCLYNHTKFWVTSFMTSYYRILLYLILPTITAIMLKGIMIIPNSIPTTTTTTTTSSSTTTTTTTILWLLCPERNGWSWQCTSFFTHTTYSATIRGFGE